MKKAARLNKRAGEQCRIGQRVARADDSLQRAQGRLSLSRIHPKSLRARLLGASRRKTAAIATCGE